MRILLVSTSYPEHAQDWRGVFIRNLVFHLADKDLKLSLWAPPGDIPQSVACTPLPREASWLKKLMVDGGIAHIIRTRGVKGAGTILTLLTLLRNVYRRHRDADVIHVNWLQNALPLWGLRKPVVVSVLGTDFGLLKIPGMTTLLRMVFSQRNTVLAPNASWMVPELERRFGDISRITYIPFGVDARWFAIDRKPRPGPRKWLAITRLTTNKIGPLFSWGSGVFGTEDELHLFGPMQEEMTVPPWVHYHGPVSLADLMDVWFPQATGLVTLSRHDEGRPQVMLEAMAASMPILASNLPAHEDMIRHQQTGWLASSRENLIEGISWLGDPKNNERTGQAARQWILRDVGTWDDCAQRYIAAYESVLQR